MASFEVLELTWAPFSPVVKASSFAALLEKTSHPSRYPLHHGPALFRPEDERTAAALRNHSLTLHQERLKIKPEWIDDALTISRYLGLDAFQSYRIRSFMDPKFRPSNAATLEMAAEKMYLTERLAMLKWLYMLFQENVEDEHAGLTVRLEELERKRIMETLVDAIEVRIKGTITAVNTGRAERPLTGGEMELHCLVDILMARFRKRCATKELLLRLCNALKHVWVQPGVFSQSLMAKLSLVPMLAYGFWTALEIDLLSGHPLNADFFELDKFFAEWSYEDGHVQIATIHLSWHLFRRVFGSLMALGADSATALAASAIDVRRVPALIQSVLNDIRGTTGESLCRDCLLMLMDACLYNTAFLNGEEHSMETFRVIAEICYRDALVCEWLLKSSVHRRLSALLTEARDWFGINPRPILTLLRGLCFPESTTVVQTFLTGNDFGVVVLHGGSDFHLFVADAPEMGPRAVKAVDLIVPSIGYQIPIEKDTAGKIWNRSQYEWLFPQVPDTMAVRWETHSFDAMFTFVFHRTVTQMHAMEPSQRDRFQLDIDLLTHLAAGYDEALSSSGLSALAQRDTAIDDDIIFVMNDGIREGRSIAWELKMLKVVCRQNPVMIADKARQTLFFADYRSWKYSMTSILDFTSPLPLLEKLQMAEGTLVLLTEFLRNRVVLPEMRMWIDMVVQKLLPRVRKVHDAEHEEARVAFFFALTEFQWRVVYSEAGKMPVHLILQSAIQDHFCLEDTVDGILKVLPGTATKLTYSQVKLVISLCQLLALLLHKDTPSHPTLASKVTKFLMTKGYWEEESPAAVLVLYATRAFSSNQQRELNIDCCVAALEFFNALLRQYERHKDAILKDVQLQAALPFEGDKVHPIFLEALLLTPLYHGHLQGPDFISAAINVLITASETDSEILSLLFFPTALIPGSQTAAPSLVDVLWCILINHQEVYQQMPRILCAALRGVRAIQRASNDQGNKAWRILKGQNAFYDNLTDIVLRSQSNLDTADNLDELGELRELREIQDRCLALALEILGAEMEHPDAPAAFVTHLQLMLESRWNAWQKVLTIASVSDFDPSDIPCLSYVANHVSFEISIELATAGMLGQVDIALPGAREIFQEVSEILDRHGAPHEGVIHYIRSALTGMNIPNQYSAIFSNPQIGFEFLTEELGPGTILIKHLLEKSDDWKSCSADLTKDHIAPSFFKTHTQRSALGSKSFPILLDALSTYLQMFVRVFSVRCQLIASWRHITKAVMTATASTATDPEPQLKSAIATICEHCRGWSGQYHGMSLHCSEMQQDWQTTCVLLTENSVYWCICFVAELTECLLDCVNAMKRFSTGEGPSEPFTALTQRRFAPPVELSQLPFDFLVDCLYFWFDCRRNYKDVPKSWKEPLQVATQNLVTLSSHIALQLKPSAEPRAKVVLRCILEGVLIAAEPAELGFGVASAALAALSKWSLYIEEWDRDLLMAFHVELHLHEHFHSAANHVRRLTVDSGDTNDDQALRLWSRNLVYCSSCLLMHSQLSEALFKDEVLSCIWSYCQALFHREGADLGCRDEEVLPVYWSAQSESASSQSLADEFQNDAHLRKAYKSDGSENFAYGQWCTLLKLIGDLALHAQHQPQSKVPLLFEKTATLMFGSFPQYFRHEFGTYREPMTLARLGRMEASLEFLLASHAVFCESPALLPQYRNRREDILSFVCSCDILMHRSDQPFVCPPVSNQEKEMHERTMSLDTELGWFRKCKEGSKCSFSVEGTTMEHSLMVSSALVVHRGPAQVPSSLTKYAWKVAAGMYRCLSLSLEYIRLSETASQRPATKFEFMDLKDVMLRLQSDVAGFGHWLTNATAMEETAEERGEMQQLAQVFFKILSLTDAFLSDWGMNRRRRHQEEFNKQVDVMQQLLVER